MSRDEFERILTRFKHDLELESKREEHSLKHIAFRRERASEGVMIVVARSFELASVSIEKAEVVKHTVSRLLTNLNPFDAIQYSDNIKRIEESSANLQANLNLTVGYYSGKFYKDLAWLNIDTTIIEIPIKIIDQQTEILDLVTETMRLLTEATKLINHDTIASGLSSNEEIQSLLKEAMQKSSQASHNAFVLLNTVSEWRAILVSKI